MGIPSCDRCGEKLKLGDAGFAGKFRDPLRIIDKDSNKVTCLEGMLGKGIGFLLCGGPSAKQLPMEQLNRRGCWTLCVNNVAGWDRLRPQAFVHSDPPSKFHNGIWTDPGIMKFTPTPKLSKKIGGIRYKVGEKDFRQILKPDGEKYTTLDAPNTWGFGRRGWALPDETFFTNRDAPWGNLDAGVKRTGEDKTVCTMLIGMRLLYHLGARTIFLVGVDFQMDPAKSLTDNYSFGEDRDDGACRSNNHQYQVVNKFLCRFANSGTFERFGLRVYNCNPLSGLRAFPHAPFEKAVAAATAGMETPFDLNGWYWKKPKKKEKRKKEGRRERRRRKAREAAEKASSGASNGPGV
jgi:hypothetical protein